MLLHLSVIHSVHGGVYPSMHWADTPWQTSPRQTTPRQTPCWPGLPLGRDPQADTPLAATAPQADTPGHTPGRDTPCRRLLRWTVRILLECIPVDIGVNSPD